ncbi:hypothetical protein AB0I10_04645 [Streptomyces sp. NPDC050636]|uniref:transketolase-like TK C-terminal-containing protein n=1 Tax=Streptomyces sp. NPDC050636 TaxID=3154510 RepID=UPI0034419974
MEAGIAQGWREIVGDRGHCVSLEHYGASASAAELFEEYGITADAIAEAARTTVQTTPALPIPSPSPNPSPTPTSSSACSPERR